MSTTPETPTPDYGEPWRVVPLSDGGIASRDGSQIVDKLGKSHRAITCVNACVGMVDPAAEIEAMRVAIISSYHMLKYFERFMPNLVDLTEQQWLNTQEGKNTVSALAKLQPFLK